MEPTGPDGGWPGWGRRSRRHRRDRRVGPPPPGPPPGWRPGRVAGVGAGTGGSGPPAPAYRVGPPGTRAAGTGPEPKGGSARTGPLPLHPMTLSDILDGAFNLFKAEARTIVLVTAAFIVPVQIVAAFLQRDYLGGTGLPRPPQRPVGGRVRPRVGQRRPGLGHPGGAARPPCSSCPSWPGR